DRSGRPRRGRSRRRAARARRRGGSVNRALVFSLGLASALPAGAQPFRREPSVAAVQRAAARHAQVPPAPVRPRRRRVRSAAALPAVKARVGHGNYGWTSLRADALGLEGTSTESWRTEIELSWQLDRLVFNRDELLLARESQRIAARRELLQTEVAQ